MLQYPGFNPIAVELGPIKVHWYGIMYLIGFAAAWWLGRVRASRAASSWKPLDVDDLVFFGMMGVIFGRAAPGMCCSTAWSTGPTMPGIR